jgi:hypothetical protein
MKITETNCETGETVERDMTAEEEAVYNVVAAEQAAEEEAKLAAEAAAEAKATAKASAIAKFQALGLTEEEALALLG